MNLVKGVDAIDFSRVNSIVQSIADLLEKNQCTNTEVSLIKYALERQELLSLEKISKTKDHWYHHKAKHDLQMKDAIAAEVKLKKRSKSK